MALARSQREWSILIGEYNICKKKLESKREALKIMTKEWQSIQRERDIYKNKINQLQQDLDKYILKERMKPKQKQQATKENNCATQSPDLLSSHTSKDSFAELLVEYKEENKALKKDLLELKKLYVESQEDVQILRDTMRRQSSSSSIGEESSSTSVLEGKQELISQLEEYKGQVASLEQELKSIKDENSDVSMERDHYKDKCERLNTQLNYILSADDQRLVDIDALVLDNKYLKEKLAQLEEERRLEKESIQKYEAAFEKKKNKLLYRGHIGHRISSYHSKHSDERSVKTVADLRNIANILSETITEKNLALSHQRSANRILGKRVNELENKLKTLEVAGLWSLPGHRGYGSINFEMNQSPNNDGKDGVMEASTATEKLEWDNSSSLVELADSEKAKPVNGNGLSEIQHVSKKQRDFEPPDLLSGSAAGQDFSQNHSPSRVRDTDNSGCHGDCSFDRITGQSSGEEEMRTGRVNGTTAEKCFSPNSDQSSGTLHDGPRTRETSTPRRLSRALSAPSLTSCESFDENDNVDGGNSHDFSAK